MFTAMRKKAALGEEGRAEAQSQTCLTSRPCGHLRAASLASQGPAPSCAPLAGRCQPDIPPQTHHSAKRSPAAVLLGDGVCQSTAFRTKATCLRANRRDVSRGGSAGSVPDSDLTQRLRANPGQADRQRGRRWSPQHRPLCALSASYLTLTQQGLPGM